MHNPLAVGRDNNDEEANQEGQDCEDETRDEKKDEKKEIIDTIPEAKIDDIKKNPEDTTKLIIGNEEDVSVEEEKDIVDDEEIMKVEPTGTSVQTDTEDKKLDYSTLQGFIKYNVADAMDQELNEIMFPYIDANIKVRLRLRYCIDLL